MSNKRERVIARLPISDSGVIEIDGRPVPADHCFLEIEGYRIGRSDDIEGDVMYVNFGGERIASRRPGEREWHCTSGFKVTGCTPGDESELLIAPLDS